MFAGKENQGSQAVQRLQAWTKLSEAQRRDTTALAESLRASGLVADRKHHILGTHRAVMIGSGIIDWLLEIGQAKSREQARQIGQRLVDGDLLHEVRDEHDFEDKHIFYRLRADDKAHKGPSVGSLIPKAKMEGWLGIRKGKSSIRARRFYCVLVKQGKMHVLYYFPSDTASSPAGFVNFEKASVKIRYHASGKHSFQLVATSLDGRKAHLTLTARSGLLDAWVQSVVVAGAQFVEQDTPAIASATNVYNFSAFDVNNRPVCLDRFRGKVLLVVNVASKCSTTAINYTQMQALYERYHLHGLEIIGFPCSQLSKEHAADAQDDRDAAEEHGIRFLLMSPVKVNGPGAHPVFGFLKSKLKGPHGCFIEDNFTKFLVDRQGIPVQRFAGSLAPFSIENAIKDLLFPHRAREAAPTAKTIGTSLNESTTSVLNRSSEVIVRNSSSARRRDIKHKPSIVHVRPDDASSASSVGSPPQRLAPNMAAMDNLTPKSSWAMNASPIPHNQRTSSRPSPSVAVKLFDPTSRPGAPFSPPISMLSPSKPHPNSQQATPLKLSSSHVIAPLSPPLSMFAGFGAPGAPPARSQPATPGHIRLNDEHSPSVQSNLSMSIMSMASEDSSVDGDDQLDYDPNFSMIPHHGMHQLGGPPHPGMSNSMFGGLNASGFQQNPGPMAAAAASSAAAPSQQWPLPPTNSKPLPQPSAFLQHPSVTHLLPPQTGTGAGRPPRHPAHLAFQSKGKAKLDLNATLPAVLASRPSSTHTSASKAKFRRGGSMRASRLNRSLFESGKTLQMTFV
eukprot:m.69795 g.69795  ORF g.69795 m.69795 type:complete len:789 (-) comp14014_c0_seq2:38-2404(-)